MDVHRQAGPHGPESLTGGYIEQHECQRIQELGFRRPAHHQIVPHLPAGSVDRAFNAPDSEG